MLSYQTIRKVVKATASRLGCSEHNVFIAYARSQGLPEMDARLVGDGNYALYCEDSLDNDLIVDDFCLSILCNQTVRIKETSVS